MKGGNMKFIVISPGGGTTGGVELLHQFADQLFKCGCDAYICYYPFSKKHEIPECYQKYKVQLIDIKEVNSNSDVVILPEVYSYLAHKFSPNRTYIWWMSVDNYINSGRFLYAVANRFSPWNYINTSSNKFNTRFAGHLYQSEYARQYLLNKNVNNLYLLSDYINEEYVLRANLVDPLLKKPILVYNPAKGIEQTKKIIANILNIEAIPIINMTRDEVIGLLSSAMIYIDFGNHPGKDRIPREAATLGCCVITNRRGSAANPVDISIGTNYKFDDESDGFEIKSANMVHEIINDFPFHYKEFDSYRTAILGEKEVFEKSVKSFVDCFDSL